MPEIVGGATPANDGERRVLAHLAAHAPDEWIILHNVEIPAHGGSYEIDLIILTHRGVCLVDIKGTVGRIDVLGSQWYPEGRQPFFSPVRKLRGHAREVKSLLTRHDPRLSKVYVDQIVVLVGRDARLVDRSDHSDADALHVTDLDELIPMLRDVSRVRAGMLRDVRPHIAAIVAGLRGEVRRPTGPKRFGDWEVCERLGGDDEVTEYRARNATAGTSETVLLRVYQADPFLPERERNAQRHMITNAYEVLAKLPPSPYVIGRRTFFASDDESQFVLVLDDVRGQALTVHLVDARQALSADAKHRVFTDLLRGLVHAHAHGVLHRALTPASVLVSGSNGRAVLTGFDYARPEAPRERTVVERLAGVLEPAYVAPECQGRVQAMSRASDVYAAGVIGFYLFTGQLPFTSSAEQFQRGSNLPEQVLARSGVTPALESLLRGMCALAPSGRPTAAEALRALVGRRSTAARPALPSQPTVDYGDLPRGHQLTHKYRVDRKLGSGSFGTVYQVYDNLADEDRVVKIVHKTPESVVERLKRELQLLLNLPRHRCIVEVRDADYLELGRIPYLVFEYVDGQAVSDLVDGCVLGPADTVRLGMDVAEGLAYLHGKGIYHCDIKPANLLRTDSGCKILDFNVATRADDSLSRVGGTTKYAPPDYASAGTITGADLIDRDVYGLGLTLYELLVGVQTAKGRVVGETLADPRRQVGLEDLSDALVEAVMRAVAPWRSERYANAAEFLDALRGVRDQVHRPLTAPPAMPAPAALTSATRNPFVDYLRTLYSQSTSSNAGTRSAFGQPFDLYVATRLDTELTPDVLRGRFRLVVITGNAGDGKTAYLGRLLQAARADGPIQPAYRENGAEFQLPDGLRLVTNHDGSQDEADRENDQVLLDFFTPFSGNDLAGIRKETRLIAINEGRLVDFISTHEAQFPALAASVRAGLEGVVVDGGVAVINLNRRGLLSYVDDLELPVFDRLVAGMTKPTRWEACDGCAIVESCYARHNARTFANASVGPKITARLRELYVLAERRGVQHITIRDIQSALAFMLTSGRSCEEIRELYAGDQTDDILNGFYFNSWAGVPGGKDRLMNLLSQLDVARVADPSLDRRLDYVGPGARRALMTVDQRADYDLRLLTSAFERLPRGAAMGANDAVVHGRYMASAKRRFYFECVDGDRSSRMLPYRSADTFAELLGRPEAVAHQLPALIDAINRSEGLTDSAYLDGGMALQIRVVPGGTIRSYRLFPANSFSMAASGGPASRYLEGGHQELVLSHRGAGGHGARLRIRLDLFELLSRLGEGYLPGVAEQQGLYLGLTIFKHELSAAPYREVLLTVTGRDRARVAFSSGVTLTMDLAGVDRGRDGTA